MKFRKIRKNFRTFRNWLRVGHSSSLLAFGAPRILALPPAPQKTSQDHTHPQGGPHARITISNPGHMIDRTPEVYIKSSELSSASGHFRRSGPFKCASGAGHPSSPLEIMGTISDACSGKPPRGCPPPAQGTRMVCQTRGVNGIVDNMTILHLATNPIYTTPISRH